MIGEVRLKGTIDNPVSHIAQFVDELFTVDKGVVRVCIHTTMKYTLRNKSSANEVWIISLALIIFAATNTISKQSFVAASDDASSLWNFWNSTAETHFGNETSAKTTYISSSSTQTKIHSESTDNDTSFAQNSSTTIQQTTPTAEPNISTSETSIASTELTNTLTESITATLGSTSTTSKLESTVSTNKSAPTTPAPTITTSEPEPATTTTETTVVPNQDGITGLIIGVVVGAGLLFILLAVLFVYREQLMGYCNNGGQNGVSHPAFAPYVPQDQETSEPENSGTSATLFSIREEFKELSSYNPAITSNIAHLGKNANENRYRDVVPYDVNIVSLKSGNYVNASHVESNFIMTQDPIMTQVDDFWQMVWEHNVSVIVRLSNDHDDRTLPSAVYIPPHRWVVGQLEVTNVADPHQRTNYSRRIIRLNDATSTVRNRVREIYHYHLGCWETNTLPPVRDFMVALQDIRKQKKFFDQMGLTRTLVHCGSGSGRTGAFVAVWLLLDSVDAEETDISVSKTVRRLREQRAHVVNKLGLYKFIYECVEFYKFNVNIPPSESPYETVVGVGNSGSSGTGSRSASPKTT